jgi:hypothetical protein
MKTLSILAALLVLTGCTTLAPGAREIRITRDTAWVRGCKAVGPVQSSPPYVLPGDDLKQIRNQAVALGANAVLLTGPRILHTAGVAYRCGA